jgi:hypothetical protein
LCLLDNRMQHFLPTGWHAFWSHWDRIVDGPAVRWWFYRYDRPALRVVAVPMWAVSLALAIPVTWMFYRDRCRRAPWMCWQCGYDRRGLSLADAACPECGRPASPPTH